MSANKKNTTKTNKSSTPTTKETKTPAKSAARKPATKRTTPVTPNEEAAATAGIVAAVVRAAAPVVVAPSASAPVKEVAGAAVRTTITAKIDVGFGNALYIRGEGPGLSWDQGRLMTNLGSDVWQVQLGEAARPFAFKFLINDVTWSVGADFTLTAGTSGMFVPQF